jgi:hypothetical protein
VTTGRELLRGALFSALIVAGGACVLDSTVPAPTAQACSVATDCDDDANPCTLARCASGVCENAPLGDGTLPPQVAGDCKLVECDGADVLVTDDPDDANDGNDCTADECSASGASHPPLDAGAPCFVGPDRGSCDGAGACVVECSAMKPCPVDPTAPCSDPTCDKANTCKYVPRTGEPLAPVPDPAGNCTKPWCSDGAPSTVADDLDLPADDLLECTIEGCNGGIPEHAPKTTNTACGTGGALYCDPAGACVECTGSAQCGTPTECATPTCTAGTCADVPIGGGLACSGGVCDGAGACVECLAPTDCTPLADPCFVRTCASMLCGQTPAGIGTACGTGGVDACDGLGSCKDCLDAGDCTELTPGECQVASCDATNACVLAPKGSGTPCSTGVCDGAGLCVACVLAADCPVATPFCCPNHTCALAAPSCP